MIEVVVRLGIEIVLITQSTDILSIQFAQLLTWHYFGSEMIFSKMRDAMEKRYVLLRIVVKHALETLVENGVVKIEEHQAKDRHHYNVYLFSR